MIRNSITAISIFIVALLIFRSDADFGLKIICLLSASWLIYELVSFIDRIEQSFTILKLIEIYAIIIYLFAPALHYLVYANEPDDKIFRPVETPYQGYFLLAIPVTVFFSIGLRLSKKYDISFISRRLTKISPVKQNRLALFITVTGVFFSILQHTGIGQTLGRITGLGYSLLFVGGLYYYFSSLYYGKILFWFIYGFGFLQGLIGGMLGTAFMWPVFAVPIVLAGRSYPLFLKLIICFLGLYSFSIFNDVKSSYREEAWYGGSGAGIQTWQKLLSDQTSDFFDPTTSEKYMDLIRRLNHAQHVSLVLQRVPATVPYEYGSTLAKDFFAVFVPRMFWKDKPQAGGFENYEKYAGISNERVSTNIGQIGEAYVNFSYAGAPVVMLLYGLLLGGLYNYLLRFSLNNPVRLFWIPFFFTDLYSMESDFFMSLNSIFSAVIFFFVIKFFIEQISGEKI